MTTIEEIALQVAESMPDCLEYITSDAAYGILYVFEQQQLVEFATRCEAEMSKGYRAIIADAVANDAAAMRWLAECRFAVGDDGKRMLPEFVEYLKELRQKAERLEELEAGAKGGAA